MTDEPIRVEISEWRPAAFEVGGETIFAVGDVHGCAAQLRALLGVIADAPSTGDRRLVFLGDLIDRGPDNLGVLALWAESPAARRVDRIDRLIGNHEQLLLLAMAGAEHAEKAEAMWRSAAMGGEAVLAEMRARTGRDDTRPSAGLFTAALGQDAYRLFVTMASHVVVGNALFVHGGLDPALEADELLRRPWTAFTDARWAWVHGEFLQWRGGFGGRLIVRGHTPPEKHRELTGEIDPHRLVFDRINLDGGTTQTGIVFGGQIETGRYRVLRAGAGL
jgi:serine/threonine protein phosphatase 1